MDSDAQRQAREQQADRLVRRGLLLLRLEAARRRRRVHDRHARFQRAWRVIRSTR